MTVELECGFCGEPIEMYKSQAEQREQTYCDEECRSKGMSERYTDNLNKGRTLTEEHKKKLSEAHKGKTIPEEVREKMSETTAENQPWTTERFEVEETGHVVRSSWEEAVDLILHNSDLSYEYEPEMISLSEYSYLPDFVVEKEVVVEVKGWLNERSEKKMSTFVQEREEPFVVVGNNGGYGHGIEYGDRDTLPQTISQIRN